MSAVGVVRAYARRVRQVDRMILACFVLGLSTRKVAHALLPVLGEPVSAGTVSRIDESLDAAVTAFHRRPLKRQYRFLILDGVVLKRRTGAGSVKRVVLVALGITPQGKKEVIDFSIAQGESREAWEAFLTDLYRRGLRDTGLEMIVVDGGNGLLAALPVVYPSIPVQRCWAHKARNVTDKVRKADSEAVKKDLHRISHASSMRDARSALAQFSRKWNDCYPSAVHLLRVDGEYLLVSPSLAKTTMSGIGRAGDYRLPGECQEWCQSIYQIGYGRREKCAWHGEFHHCSHGRLLSL